MLKIRPYRKNDSRVIVTWCNDPNAFYKWSAGIYGEYPLSAEKLEQAVSGRYDNERYFPFTAFDENGAVGYFTLRQPDNDPSVLRFGFVILSPEVRGKGYGKQMLRLGMKFAFELYGADKVTLGVFENNPAAYHCYRAVGFTETGQSSFYDICGEQWKCIELELKRSEQWDMR